MLIDVALVEYTDGSRAICRVPYGALSIGDHVETDWDRGIVTATCSIVANSNWEEFLKKLVKCDNAMTKFSPIPPIEEEAPDGKAEK